MQIRIGCHALCATAIPVFLEAGGTPENAHVMLAHEPAQDQLFGFDDDTIGSIEACFRG
jgi:hypothetical protein